MRRADVIFGERSEEAERIPFIVTAIYLLQDLTHTARQAGSSGAPTRSRNRGPQPQVNLSLRDFVVYVIFNLMHVFSLSNGRDV